MRALAGAGQTLGTIEIGTQGRVANCLAQAESRRQAQLPSHPHDPAPAVYGGGMVLPVTAGVQAEHESAASMKSLADRARAEFGATLGLAIGAARPGPDGRSVLMIALSDGQRVEQVEHMLGGGPTLALSRAAKTAVDLVRRKLEPWIAPS